MNQQRPIGIFDSGVGGLTVLRQIKQLLPHESFVYFADTAHVPYGEKSTDLIVRYSLENVLFLLQQDVKLIVVACSTSSSVALNLLCESSSQPVMGMIDPGVERAVAVTRHGKIAVLGTRATIRSGVYQEEIRRRMPHATVHAIPCPLFVPLIEESFCSHSAAKLIVKEYLTPLHAHDIDTILLGCTHYPLLRSLIEEEFGNKAEIIDPAICCAEKVSALLHEHELHAASKTPPQHQFFVSGDPHKFCQLGSAILGMPLENVQMIPNYTSPSCL